MCTNRQSTQRAQRDGDLGARMHAAFSATLDVPSLQKAVLVGTDIPGVTSAVLMKALNALETSDVCVFVAH